MTRTLILLVAAASAFGAADSPAVAQNAAAGAHVAALDFSGVHAFWRIQEILASDREPMDQEWAQLFATPGYAILDEKEGRRDALAEAMRLAYSPSRSADRESAIARGGWIGYVVPHLVRILTHRAELERIEREMTTGGMFAEGARLAQAWLPAGVTETMPPPPVSFLVFGDARGYPERLLFDLLFFLELGDGVEVLGHEMHHYYRAHSAPARRPFGEDWVAWTLMTTENEGIAGLIDKRDVPDLDAAALAARFTDERRRRYYEEYQDHHRRSDEWLAWTDSLLTRIGAEPDSAAALGLRFHREIPDNGRIMGAYMAEVIVEAFGRDALIEVVGEPFRFWARYNRAAAAAGTYVLSGAAMAVIEGKERAYSP